MLEQCPNRVILSSRGNADASSTLAWAKAKRVKFYRNGDAFHEGMYYAISERFRTFESLLVTLTYSSVCDPKVLPTGVRFIFTLDGRRITSIDEFVDGECYVCASTDHFKRVAYLKSPVRTWNPMGSSGPGSGTITARRIRCSRQTSETDQARNVDESESTENDSTYKPRLITVVRNGIKPRKIVRVLLSSRTARSFTQALDTIGATFQAAPIRRLYTLDKKQVTTLNELLQNDESVFLACGNERQTTSDFILTEYEIRNLILQQTKGTATTMPVAISTEIVSNSRKGSLTSSASIVAFNRQNSLATSSSAPATPQSVRRFTDEKMTTPPTAIARPDNLPLRNERAVYRANEIMVTNCTPDGVDGIFQFATPDYQDFEKDLI